MLPTHPGGTGGGGQVCDGEKIREVESSEAVDSNQVMIKGLRPQLNNKEKAFNGVKIEAFRKLGIEGLRN